LINGMVDSVASEKVKFHHKSRAYWGVNLDKLLPLCPQFLSAGTGVLGGTFRYSLALHSDAWQNVTLQHLLQFLLVAHQLVQRVHWNLIKGRIGGGEDSEGSGPGEVLHHAGGFQGCVEGGEVLVLSNHGGHTLPGLLDSNGGLGGSLGDGVDVWSAEVMRVLRAGSTDREVVVESSDKPRLVRAG